MRPKILSIAVALLLVSAAYARSSAQERHHAETGLSIAEMQSLLKALPPLPGTIQAIRFLRRDKFWVDRAAILTQGQDSGWQVFVLHLENTGKFSLEWKSGRLDDSFAVSSVNQLQTLDLGASAQGLGFSGCAAHNCPNGVFSVLLYVPSKRTAFFAKSVLGKITYSPSLGLAENSEYKETLAQLVKDRASQ